MRDDDEYLTYADVSDYPNSTEDDVAFGGSPSDSELEDLLQWHAALFPFKDYVARIEFDKERTDPYMHTGARILGRIPGQIGGEAEIAEIANEYDANGLYKQPVADEAAQCIASILAVFGEMGNELLRRRKGQER